MADEETQYNDGDSPETTDGQIRPPGVRPGEPAEDQGPEPSASSGAAQPHTSAEDGHPDLADDGAGRSKRDLGGPKLSDEEREADPSTTTGGAKGDIQTKGMEPHQ